MSRSGPVPGLPPAPDEPVRSIHLVKPLTADTGPRGKGSTARETPPSRNLIQFPLHPGAEPKLAPRAVSEASVVTLALAAAAPLFFWMGHAVLVWLHLLRANQ